MFKELAIGPWQNRHKGLSSASRAWTKAEEEVGVEEEDDAVAEDVEALHYGTKPGHFETSKIHFPTSERCERTSERTSEWPSTYVSILVCSRP